MPALGFCLELLRLWNEGGQGRGPASLLPSSTRHGRAPQAPLRPRFVLGSPRCCPSLFSPHWQQMSPAGGFRGVKDGAALGLTAALAALHRQTNWLQRGKLTTRLSRRRRRRARGHGEPEGPRGSHTLQSPSCLGGNSSALLWGQNCSIQTPLTHKPPPTVPCPQLPPLLLPTLAWAVGWCHKDCPLRAGATSAS